MLGATSEYLANFRVNKTSAPAVPESKCSVLSSAHGFKNEESSCVARILTHGLRNKEHFPLV